MVRWAFGCNTLFGYTLPLSLRRSTINVENVVVRLWQSRAICLRAECPQCFFYLLDRHASLAMTRGSKGGFLGLSDHPVDYVDTPQ